MQSQTKPKAVFFQDGSGFVFPAGGQPAGMAAAGYAASRPMASATPPYGGVSMAAQYSGGGPESTGRPARFDLPVVPETHGAHLVGDYARYQEHEIAELKRKMQATVYERNREVDSLRAQAKDLDAMAQALRAQLHEAVSERDNYRAMLGAEARARADVERQLSSQSEIWDMSRELSDQKRAEAMRDADDSAAEVRLLRDKLDSAESAFMRLRGDRDAAAAAAHRLEAELDELAARWSSAKEDCERLSAELRRRSEETESLSLGRKRDEHARAALEADRAALGNEVAAAGEELRRLRAEREDALRVRASLERELGAQGKELAAGRAECEAAAGALARAEARAATAEAEAAECRRATADADVNARLAAHEKGLAEKSAAEADARASKLTAQVVAAAERCRELELASRDHAALREALGETRAELGLVREKLAAATSERDRADSERRAAATAGADAAREVGRLSSELAAASSEAGKAGESARSLAVQLEAAGAERRALESQLADVTERAAAAAAEAARRAHDAAEAAAAERAASGTARRDLEARVESQRAQVEKAAADIARLKEDRRARAEEAAEAMARLRGSHEAATEAAADAARDERNRLVSELAERAAELAYLRPFEAEVDDLRQKVSVLAAELHASNVDGERALGEHRALARRFEESEAERGRLAARRVEDLKEIGRVKQLESALAERGRGLAEAGRRIGELEGRLGEAVEGRADAEAAAAGLRARLAQAQSRAERAELDSEVQESVLRALTAVETEAASAPPRRVSSGGTRSSYAASGREQARDAGRELRSMPLPGRAPASQQQQPASHPQQNDELRSYLASLDESIRNITGLYD